MRHGNRKIEEVKSSPRTMYPMPSVNILIDHDQKEDVIAADLQP